MVFASLQAAFCSAIALSSYAVRQDIGPQANTDGNGGRQRAAWRRIQWPHLPMSLRLPRELAISNGGLHRDEGAQ